MIPLRILVGIAASAVVAVAVAGVLRPRGAERAPAPAPVPPPPAAEPLRPAPYRDVARPRVPAGILARAAGARALERGPSCIPPVEERGAARCGESERESIDIEWHVARDP